MQLKIMGIAALTILALFAVALNTPEDLGNTPRPAVESDDFTGVALNPETYTIQIDNGSGIPFE